MIAKIIPVDIFLLQEDYIVILNENRVKSNDYLRISGKTGRIIDSLISSE